MKRFKRFSRSFKVGKSLRDIHKGLQKGKRKKIRVIRQKVAKVKEERTGSFTKAKFEQSFFKT